MNHVPITSSRVTSEKRAAAARANGAKSRGPVTAIGKSNSFRNSITQEGEPFRHAGSAPCPRNAEKPGSASGQHGLRSRTLFTDPESAGQLNHLLASFESEFHPHSEIEHTLVRTMALTRWRQTCLWKLETSLINRETSRLKSLMSNEAPVTLIALAFRSLIDHSCSLQIINRLESRCELQYNRAVDRLTALRAHGVSEKTNIHERPQQVIENTAPHSGPTHFDATNATDPGELPKKTIVNEPSQQLTENKPPYPELTPFHAPSTLKADG